MDIGQWIAIGLSIILGVWYVIASFINRRRGVATYEWLRAGLVKYGKIGEAKWIGSSGSGARLSIAKADKPFRQIEVIFLLESREILPIWLFNRIRNKQDEMVLKANLRQVTHQEVEAAPKGDRKLRGLHSASVETQSPFEQVPAPDGFEIIRRGGSLDEMHLDHLRVFLTKHSESIFQFSLRRKMPHLILRAKLPPLRTSSSEIFLSDLSDLLSSPQ